MIQRFGSSARAHATAVALFSFLVYFITRVPGLYYTDSGELAAACATLGIAHPTGYPLFTLLGHIWCMLPWSSAIVGLNILAGVWTAAAVGMLVLLIWELINYLAATPSKATKSKESPSALTPLTALIIADVAALLFAFSETVWSQGTSIEVYSLQVLVTTLALWCTIKSLSDVKNVVRWTCLASLCVGLMLSNHVSSVFVLPGLVLLWYSGVRQTNTARQLLVWLIAPAVLVCGLYAYLPLRSAQLPPINWGLVHRNLDAFLYHVKGTQFSLWLFSDSSDAEKNIAIAARLFAASVLFVGIIPVVVGFVQILRKRNRVAFGLLLFLLGNVIISVGYSIPDIDSYFLPMLVITALLFAVGLHAMLGRYLKSTALATSLLALPIIALVIGWSVQDRSKHVAVDAYTSWLIANVEPNGIVLSRQWDYFCSAFWYKQAVEHERPDVVMIEKELLRRTWYLPYLQYRHPDVMKGVKAEVDSYMELLVQFENDADAFKENSTAVQQIQQRYVALINAILATNSTRPLYTTFEIINDEKGLAEGYDYYPVGPLRRLTVGGVKGQRLRYDHTDELVEGLRGHNERLDDGLRKLVRNNIATDIRYAKITGDSADVSHLSRIDAQLIQRRRK